MMTAHKKAGLPAWGLLAALAFTTLVIIACEQEPNPALPAPAKEGVLTINGAKEGIFYTADVYKYSSAVPNAEQLDYITSTFEIIGTWADQTSYSTREINLKTVNNDTIFTSDGKFLVILTGINSDAGLVKYKASVPFTGGRATIDYADMETAPVVQDEPDAARRTVTFDLNYEDAPQTIPNQEVNEGGYAKRPADPTRWGHTFGGWFTDAECTAKWDFGTDTVKEYTVLYAKWTQIFYTVIFDLNYTGAPESPSSLSVAYGRTITEPFPAPQRTGDTFGGWYTSTDYTTKWDFDTNIVTGNLHLYAKWNPSAALASFAAAITEMAANKNMAAMTYYLPSGEETYDGSPALNLGNCHAIVTINGGGRVVTGTQDGDGIVVGAGITLAVTNLTLDNLKFSVDGTLVLGAGVVMRGTLGGSRVSVRYGGELEMRDGAHIAEGTYGGVALGPWGSGPTSAPPKFTMMGGKISGAYGQGGVFMLAPNSEFTMTGGEISGNSDNYMGGGGVKMAGAGSKFYMSGSSTISNNYANLTTGKGGGVAVIGAGSEFHMSGGTITGNSALNGGGVMVDNCVFTMNGGEISGNNAPEGGGVYLNGSKSIDANGIRGAPQEEGPAPQNKGWIHSNTSHNIHWP